MLANSKQKDAQLSQL